MENLPFKNSKSPVKERSSFYLSHPSDDLRLKVLLTQQRCQAVTDWALQDLHRVARWSEASAEAELKSRQTDSSLEENFNVVVSAFQTAAPSSKVASAGRPTWRWPFLSALSSKTCLWTSVWTRAPRGWGALFICGLFVPENALWRRVSVPGKILSRAVRGSMSLRLPVPSLLPPRAGKWGRVSAPLSRRRVRELREWGVFCCVPDTGSR